MLVILSLSCIPMAQNSEQISKKLKKPDRNNNNAMIALVPPSLQDIGITPPVTINKEAVLQQQETLAIGNFTQFLNTNDLNSKEGWQKTAKIAREMIQFKPLSQNDLQAQIDTEFKGDVYPESTPPSMETIMQEQKILADEFYGLIESNIETITDTQLVDVRMKMTLSLAFIHLQREHNDPQTGVPEELLELAQTKARDMRDIANIELKRRGLLNN